MNRLLFAFVIFPISLVAIATAILSVTWLGHHVYTAFGLWPTLLYGWFCLGLFAVGVSLLEDY